MKKVTFASFFSLALATFVGAGCTATSSPNVSTDTSAATGTNGQTATTTETEKTSPESETTNPGTTPSQTETTTPPPSTNTDSTPTTVDASVYADGTYSATGTYSSPAGKEQTPVTLTLVDDVITDVTFTVAATNPTSKQFQTMFANNFKTLVVGKNIDDVHLTKVSGSSLTPKGFNDALAQIKTEAHT